MGRWRALLAHLHTAHTKRAQHSGQQSGVVQCLAVCDDAYLLHEPNTLRKQLNTLIAAQRDVTRRRMTGHHKE
mgnify:CR=1 FL=1